VRPLKKLRLFYSVFARTKTDSRVVPEVLYNYQCGSWALKINLPQLFNAYGKVRSLNIDLPSKVIFFLLNAEKSFII
jgi:hypothetical protein